MAFFAGLLTIVGSDRVPWLGSPMLFGMVLAATGMFFKFPRWWGPRWYRRMSPRERDQPDISDPLTAVVVAAGPARVSSAKQARTVLGSGKPVAQWRGGWVYDPDTDERAHPLAPKGTIEGILMLHAAGLVFAASRHEDAIRDKATVLVIEREDVTSVRVVPARAGADGVPRRGRLHRSWYPRLVVDTADASYVFDVNFGRARQASETIKRAFATSA